MNPIYEKLAKFLHDVSPAGYPQTEKGLELVETLFTPEGAEVAIHLSLDPEPTQVIAGRCGKDLSETVDLLEKMYLDGLIRKHTGEKGASYAALSMVPGIGENVMYNRTSDKKLYDLFFDVFAEDLTALIRGRTGLTRVVPVESTIPSGTSVRPYEQAERMIRNAPEPIVVLSCGCRGRMKCCDNPKEVCLAFGDHAQYFVDTQMAGRKIDKDEALEVLKMAEEAGLVHNFINYKDNEISWVCNCCKCCCMLMATSNLLAPEGEFKGATPSSYIAQLDGDRCSGCEVCIDRCQTYALVMDGDTARLKTERCIGCGLCVTTCPEEALALVKREADQIPEYPDTLTEYVKKANQERFQVEP